MASSSSISGLVSGLDTATIISQLITLEAAPQTRLKKQLSTENSVKSALQAINTQVAALATQAKELAKPGSWQALTVTSSSTAVAASATTSGTSGATTGSGNVSAGSFSFTVDQVASAHRMTFASTAARTDTVVPSGTTVQLTVGGETRTLETGDGTLAGLANALNGAGTGVQAATVRLDDGSYRLVVTAASSGTAGAFTLTDADGGDLLGGAAVTQGRNAQITVGSDVISSASNTFTDVLPGLTFTVSAPAVGTTVDLTSTRDGASTRDGVKSLVDNVNALLTRIDSLSSKTGTSAGVLARESSVRDLRNAVLQSVYPADGSSMAGFGIQLDRYGKLQFDGDAFDKAYAADPVAVQGAFTTGTSAGFAARLHTVTDRASDAYTGTLSDAIEGRDQSISRLTDRIEDWDTRLELKRTALTRQYTALETALSALSSQSSWLGSQLSSLNSGSN